MVRRIAVITLLEPEPAADHARVKANTFPWETLNA